MSGRKNDRVWKTRDGREYPIHTMSNDHLLNTIAYLLRRSDDAIRVKGVTYVLDYEKTFEAWEAFPIFEDLVDEAKKRGLDWDLSQHWQPPTHILTLESEDGALALPRRKPGVIRDRRPACLVERQEFASAGTRTDDDEESAGHAV